MCCFFNNIFDIRVWPEGKCSNPALIGDRYHVPKRGSPICKYQVFMELYNEAFIIIMHL